MQAIQKGFTLIELIIAITIINSISVKPWLVFFED